MSGIGAASGKAADLLVTLKQLMAGAGDTLAVAGVIKGKVLRVVSEGHYSIQFGQREVTVDSALPLRVNDTVLARAESNGQLSLKKVGGEARSHQAVDEPLKLGSGITASPQQAEAWLAQRLSAPELAAMQQAISASGEGEALNQISIMLKRAGLEVTAPLLKAVNAALQKTEAGAVFDVNPKAAIAVALGSDTAEDGRAATLKLGEQLASAMRAQTDRAPGHTALELSPAQLDDPSQLSQGDAGMSDGDREQARAQWALNLQQEGSINHRIGCIPLMVEGQLVELSVALFDERGGRDGDQRSGFSKVVFDLNLPRLGHVAVNLAGIGTHLDVGLTASEAEASRLLVEHSDTLRGSLNGLGWHVDRLRYFTELGNGRAPVRTVLQHQIAGDSLARWV